ncbi:MAG: hypothetical protein HDT32_03905 [Clostridiales bacterium]|nr:hypothetical protein [Clostridiales bacterium]
MKRVYNNIIEMENITDKDINSLSKNIISVLKADKFPQLRLSNNGDSKRLTEENIRKSYSSFLED